MNDDVRHKLGAWGEEQAVCYLEKRGFRIVERGFHCRFGEIDIIAESQNELIFCEVKTRRLGALAPPQEAVSISKQRRLIKTAAWYLNRHPWDGNLRFDVIAITAPKSGYDILEIEWFQDAFPGEL